MLSFEFLKHEVSSGKRLDEMEIGGRDMTLNESSEGSIVSSPDEVGLRSSSGVWAGKRAIEPSVKTLL